MNELTTLAKRLEKIFNRQPNLDYLITENFAKYTFCGYLRSAGLSALVSITEGLEGWHMVMTGVPNGPLINVQISKIISIQKENENETEKN